LIAACNASDALFTAAAFIVFNLHSTEVALDIPTDEAEASELSSAP